MMSELEKMALDARDHANNLRADINNAMTRQEHIRLSRLAIEADTLAGRLESFVGKVAPTVTVQ